jgi:hypothetical protein
MHTTSVDTTTLHLTPPPSLLETRDGGAYLCTHYHPSFDVRRGDLLPTTTPLAGNARGALLSTIAYPPPLHFNARRRGKPSRRFNPGVWVNPSPPSCSTPFRRKETSLPLRFDARSRAGCFIRIRRRGTSSSVLSLFDDSERNSPRRWLFHSYLTTARGIPLTMGCFIRIR